MCCFLSEFWRMATLSLVLFISSSQFAESDIQTCEEKGLIKHINWNELSADNALEIPKHSCNLDFDTISYKLEIDCNLEYLGYATDYFLYKNRKALGITYVLDFASFDTSRYRVYMLILPQIHTMRTGKSSICPVRVQIE